MVEHAQRRRQSDHKVQLGVRINPHLRTLIWQEVHRRALAGIVSSRSEVVEQALTHYLATNISADAYIAMDLMVAEARAAGEHASRASIMSEAIMYLYAAKHAVIVEQSGEQPHE